MERVVLILVVVAASHARSIVQIVRPCPNISCLAQVCEPPKIDQDMFGIFEGVRCSACSECVYPPRPRPSCPDFQCDIPICQPGEFLFLHTTFEFEGRTCQGCPDCRPAPNPLPNFCPNIDCLPTPPECDNPQCRISTFEGKECQACCICPEVFETTKSNQVTTTTTSNTTTTTVPSPPPPMCPSIDCFLSTPCGPNEELVATRFEFNGLTCRGCPVCQQTPVVSESCPLVRCLFFLPLPCFDGFELTPRAFENANGEVCLGCSACLPKCEPVACLEPNCSIQNQIPTSIVQNGRACAGCPVCRETTSVPSTMTPYK